MNIKETTLKRFQNWCNSSAPQDTFTTGGMSYTRDEFEATFLGKVIEEHTHADLEQPYHAGDIEEY